MNEFYAKLDELYRKGDIEAVEEYLLNAVGETDESSPQRAGLLNELAGFYRGVSRYAESEKTFIQSLAIFEAAGMEATPEYATVLLNLAGLHRLTGAADKAIELFRSAMRKLEDADARDSYAYVSILNNLALAFQSNGDLTQALEYASKALELMRAGSGNEHEVASSLNNLASIRLGLGQLDTADELIAEALGIFDAMPEPDVHHAAALTTKAVLMCRKGNHLESLSDFQRALELTKRFFGENIEFAVCKRNISEVFELLGDVSSAITELSDAVRIMDKLLGSEHASVLSARNRLNQLVEKQGKSE